MIKYDETEFYLLLKLINFYEKQMILSFPVPLKLWVMEIFKVRAFRNEMNIYLLLITNQS